MAAKKVQLNSSVLRQVREYLARVVSAGIPVERALVFGSQAKGTARSDSDIDIAIVSPAFGKDRFDERVMLMNLRQPHSIVEPHPLNPSDLDDQWDSFVQEIKAHGLEISC